MKTNWFCIFHNFYNILYFDEFCRLCCFEYLKSTFIKNLKMDSSFFRIFISNLWKIQIWPTDFLKTGFSGFCENRPVVTQFFNPWVDLLTSPYILFFSRSLIPRGRAPLLLQHVLFLDPVVDGDVWWEMRATAELARTTWIHVSFGKQFSHEKHCCGPS
jgi:hypothetical protein